MTRLKQVTWAVPVTLGALVVALVLAVVVARKERQSPPSVAPQVSVRQQTTSTQAASFDTYATYGAGLTHVVPSPVASLRPTLGDQWRELGHTTGRLLVSPSGTRSRYFEIGLVAFAPQRSARLEVLTSTEQRGLSPVDSRVPEVLNFGPFLASRHGRTGVAFTSVQPHSANIGASLVLSPLQAEYLAPVCPLELLTLKDTTLLECENGPTRTKAA